VSTQITAAESKQPLVVPGSAALPGRYARFGNFLVDGEREELFRDGQRIRVQGKVYQALIVLMARAGEIVSREEVRQRVWPEAPVSTLDANVNTAMNKVRHLLGDSPEKPVYIETIPRRGYCFIAAVQFSDVVNVGGVEGGKDDTSPRVASLLARLFHAMREQMNPLPLIGLLIAATVVGALLMLAWSRVAAKDRGAAKSEKEVVTLVYPGANIRQGVSHHAVVPFS